MSCCNENCRQGRDCPARIERLRKIAKRDEQIFSGLDALLVLATLALCAWLVSGIWSVLA